MEKLRLFSELMSHVCSNGEVPRGKMVPPLMLAIQSLVNKYNEFFGNNTKALFL